MCTGLELVGIAGLASSVGGLVSTLAQPKPKTPPVPQVQQAEPKPARQAEKQASAEVGALNESRRRLRAQSSAEKHPTLFTGAEGIPDSELNLGKSFLVG